MREFARLRAHCAGVARRKENRENRENRERMRVREKEKMGRAASGIRVVVRFAFPLYYDGKSYGLE